MSVLIQEIIDENEDRLKNIINECFNDLSDDFLYYDYESIEEVISKKCYEYILKKNEVGENELSYDDFLDYFDINLYEIKDSRFSSAYNLREIIGFIEDYAVDLPYSVYKYCLDDGVCKIDDMLDVVCYSANNDVELANCIIDEFYGSIGELSREILEKYFDYEAYGRDIAYDFYKTDDYYIEVR